MVPHVEPDEGRADASSRPPRAIFAGLATLDVIQLVNRLPHPNEKVAALDFLLAAGGPAANAAVAFAACGGAPCLVTALPEHPLTGTVTDDLEHETFHPSRPLSRARDAGVLGAGGVVPLGAILARDHPGRASDGERIVVSPVGLGIEVSGRSILVLPDELGDVQVEASVDASAFRGTLGVVHHVREMHDAGAFELSTEGRAALVSEQPAGRKVLDEASCTAPGCPCTLTVSAVGRHFKGIVDGATVVHGHMDPREAGRVGLLLDGSGIVRVHSLGAIPVNQDGAGSPGGSGRSRS